MTLYKIITNNIKISTDDVLKDYIKLNYRCPKGTVDDTYSCGKTKEERAKNIASLKEKKASYSKGSSKKLSDKKSSDNKPNIISDVEKNFLSKQANAKSAYDALQNALNDPKITKDKLDKLQSNLQNAMSDFQKASSDRASLSDKTSLSDNTSPNKPSVSNQPNKISKINKESPSVKKTTSSTKIAKQSPKKPSNKESVKSPNGKSNEVDAKYAINDNKINNMLDDTQKVWDSLSQDQKDGLEWYTSTDYQKVNQYLYGDKNLKNEEIGDGATVKDRVSQIDSIMGKSSIPDDVIVYRGVSEETLSKMGDVNVGDEIQMNGYMSTSYDEDVPKMYARGDHTAVMKILVPKGTKGLNIEDHSNFKTEKEVLLDRGMKLKVKSVDKKTMLKGRRSITTITYEII